MNNIKARVAPLFNNFQNYVFKIKNVNSMICFKSTVPA